MAARGQIRRLPRAAPQARQRDHDLLAQWHGFTQRFPAVATALAQLPTRTAIIDAEVVAVTAQGLPDFAALLRRTAKPEDICCYCFDLLRHNSLDTRPLPLLARRARLEKILGRFGNGCLLLSQTFSDPDRLLAECETLGLEGIVSKRKDAPYRSGKGDWIKAWREVNRYRGELFNQR